MSQVLWPGLSTPPPSRVDQVREGDRYELSEGEAIYCAPATPRHGRPHAIGALPLGTDPAVGDIGADIGHALGERTLRAPDLSVGDLGENEGTWATKAPPLAIEYAAQGQDEADLQTKIRQFLESGSRFVWVVRLVGPRRVEVHERGRPVRTKLPGERLEAPGLLQSRPLVEALYDREAAFDQALQNLLERKGYAGLDAALTEAEARGRQKGLLEGEERGRQEGLREGEAKGLREGEAKGLREGEAKGLREGEAKGLREGEAKGLRAAVLDLCEMLGIAVTDERHARLEAANLEELEALRQAIKRERRWPG